MAKSVYDKIKRQNGETFAKTIRAFDSGIFEVDDLEKIVRHAGRDAEPLLEYLESLKHIKIEEENREKNPFELLEEAGYQVIYADTLEKQNQIFSYFAKDEMLCTFKDADRYQNYYILHCIQKNARSINREDFRGKEKREDAYGVSVISIQILKTGGFIKICNRYNHTVDYPDNTFYSDPDRIISGLSASLKKYFNVDFSSKKHIFLPEGYLQAGEQVLKYYKEVNNTYFGNGFYFKDGVLTLIDKNSQLQIDHLILDLKSKTILNPSGVDKSSLHHILEHEISGETLQVKNENGVLSLCSSMGEILKLKEGCLKELTLFKTTALPENFLSSHKWIERFKAFKVTVCPKSCLNGCSQLKEVDFENLTTLERDFCNQTRCQIKASELSAKGIKFFDSLAFDENKKTFVTTGYFKEKLIDVLNQKLSFGNVLIKKEGEIYHILLEEKPFLIFKNNALSEIYFEWHFNKFPQGYVFSNLPDLEVFSSENLTVFGGNNLINCPKLKKVSFKNLVELFECNLSNCDLLEEVDAPELLVIGRNCFSNNKNYKKVCLKKLYKAENSDCFFNSGFEEVILPNLCYAGRHFCSKNQFLKKICVENLKCLGEYSFSDLNSLEEISFPSLQYVEGRNIVQNNPFLKKASFYKLMNVPGLCLEKCPLLQEVYLNAVYRLDGFSLKDKRLFKYIYAPKVQIIDEEFLKALPKDFHLEAPFSFKVGQQKMFKENPFISLKRECQNQRGV